MAANLAVLRPSWQVSPYLLDAPTPPCVQVGGLVAPVEYQTFGTAHPLFTFGIEAALLRSSDIGSQQQLDSLMDGGEFDLSAAVEDDARLTSRLLDDATLEISQEPACDDLECVFQTQGPFVSENGTRLLLATWHVRVMT